MVMVSTMTRTKESQRRLEDDSVHYIKAAFGDVGEFIRRNMRREYSRAAFVSGVLEISEDRARAEGWMPSWREPGAMTMELRRMESMTREIKELKAALEKTQALMFQYILSDKRREG